MDGQVDGISPHSTGLPTLLGPLPKNGGENEEQWEKDEENYDKTQKWESKFIFKVKTGPLRYAQAVFGYK